MKSSLFACLLAACWNRSEPSAPTTLEPPPLDGCELRLVTRVGGASTGTLASPDQHLVLEAVLENTTQRDLTITITNNCPGLLAGFTGFGNVELYGSECMLGMCHPSTPATREIMISARGTHVLSTTALRTKMTCDDAPVAPGTYRVQFGVPIVSTPAPRTCVREATVIVK